MKTRAECEGIIAGCYD